MEVSFELRFRIALLTARAGIMTRRSRYAKNNVSRYATNSSISYRPPGYLSVFDQGVSAFDLRKTCAAQPSATAMAGGTPDIRRDRDHSLDPDRADHGALRDRLDHRRSRARPDRSRLGAWDDYGHGRYALCADGADCRQRALACQSADGPRRARHQLSDDLQSRGRRKGRAQRALPAE